MLSAWCEAIPVQSTRELYTTFAGHFVDYFKTLDGITTDSGSDYTLVRLRSVQRDTVMRELTALRNFVSWCKSEGHLAEAPVILPPPEGKKGVPHPKGKKTSVHVDADEVADWLEHLPEKSPRGGRPRAFFTFAWETSLRPATLHKLRAPDDYKPGRPTLRVRAEADKVGFARELPLSAKARAALDSVCPDTGLIFPPHDYRRTVRKAALASGLDPEKAKHLSRYDLRHGRITSGLEQSGGNLPGVAFMAGHKQVTTTNRYFKPEQKAAERAIEAIERGDSGALSGAGPVSLDLLTPEQRSQLIEIIGGFLVGTRGIEPRTPTVSRKRTRG